jgi:hypothetical protein
VICDAETAAQLPGYNLLPADLSAVA